MRFCINASAINQLIYSFINSFESNVLTFRKQNDNIATSIEIWDLVNVYDKIVSILLTHELKGITAQVFFFFFNILKTIRSSEWRQVPRLGPLY